MGEQGVERVQADGDPQKVHPLDGPRESDRREPGPFFLATQVRCNAEPPHFTNERGEKHVEFRRLTIGGERTAGQHR
jgi:hypothetical protein